MLKCTRLLLFEWNLGSFASVWLIMLIMVEFAFSRCVWLVFDYFDLCLGFLDLLGFLIVFNRFVKNTTQIVVS